MKFDQTNFLSSQNFRILFLKLIQPHYCLNNVITTKNFTTLSQQNSKWQVIINCYE